MYQAISEIMERLDAETGAAETHGIATGMLTVETRIDAGNWLGELVTANAGLSTAEEQLLLDLFELTRRQLIDAEDEFAFDLCLPDLDDPLPEQAEALRCWCIGFLFGIGYEQSGGDWPGETAEILRDLIEFTKIETDIHDDDEAGALIEIQEYIRAAVFVVRDHFKEAGYGSSH
jgi:hypothetical protein